MYIPVLETIMGLECLTDNVSIIWTPTVSSLKTKKGGIYIVKKVVTWRMLVLYSSCHSHFCVQTGKVESGTLRTKEHFH